MRGIYKITNTTNGKCYIGKSENLENRIKYHTKTLRAGYNKNQHMQNAYNIAGIGNFTIEVIEALSEDDDINEREIYWIAYYKSNEREYGYNKTLGGDGGNSFFECLTDEEKEEYLKKNKRNNAGENNPNYGKHCYTDGNIIKYISDEDIEEYVRHGWKPGVPETTKINEHYANLGEKNGFYGKKHSDESKKKISDSRKGEKNWNHGKLIYHKDNQQKYISPEEVESYEAAGWCKGMAPYVIEKIRKSKTGKKRTKYSN